MTPDVEALGAAVLSRYSPDEFPALWQIISSGERPIDGLRVLDSFPVFHNTLAHHWAMLAAGADLTIRVGTGIPDDPAVTGLLAEWGIPVVSRTDPTDTYDVVLDTAGHNAGQPTHHGYVELTKSGESVYADCDRPVFLIDAGRIKLIENTLGTGDGFVRAMTHLGHPVTPDMAVVVFGAGKVGLGTVGSCRALGAPVTVVDSAARLAELEAHLPGDVTAVASEQYAEVVSAITSAGCVVTATGVPAALSSYADELERSSALLANMGADDEFGAAVPPARVLHDKAPVNFALPEPTRLRFIDPSLALAVVGAEAVATGELAPGINVPAPQVEERILRTLRDHGTIAQALATMGL